MNPLLMLFLLVSTCMLSQAPARGVSHAMASVATTPVAHVKMEADAYVVLRGWHVGVWNTFYSRNEALFLEGEKNIINREGLAVLGYEVDHPTADPVPLVVPPDVMTYKATPSTGMKIRGNLSNHAPPLKFDPARPSATANWILPFDIYDAEGDAYKLVMYVSANGFEDSKSPNLTFSYTWHLMGTAETQKLISYAPMCSTPPCVVAEGTLVFGARGELLDSVHSDLVFEPLNGRKLPFTMDFGTPRNRGGSGVDGTRGTPIATTLTTPGPDGQAGGSVTSVALDDGGTFNLVFTSGQKRPWATVAMGRFYNICALLKLNETLHVETEQSGRPLITAISQGYFTVVPGR